MNVAIYARYSSENQRDASIADQTRSCRLFAERQGWTIRAEYRITRRLVRPFEDPAFRR